MLEADSSSASYQHALNVVRSWAMLEVLETLESMIKLKVLHYTAPILEYILTMDSIYTNLKKSDRDGLGSSMLSRRSGGCSLQQAQKAMARMRHKACSERTPAMSRTPIEALSETWAPLLRIAGSEGLGV